MPPKLTPEQECLFNAAQFTWLRRGAAKAAGMPFGEESVTETILLDLKLSYPGSLQIIPFNKHQEGKIGADWEWCFASVDHQFFQRMLVQAKVLDDPELEYAHTDRKIGNSGVRQIDRLIDSAQQRGIPALYAFYNHVTRIGRLPSNCQTIGATHPNPMPPCWGVSVANAHAVRSALPDKSFDTLCNSSIPLHCLLCTQGRGAYAGGGSPQAVARALAFLEFGPDSPAGDPTEFSEPSRERPPYFETVMRFASIGDPDEKESIREKLAAENPEIDGIVLLVDHEKKPRPQRPRSMPNVVRAARRPKLR